MNAAANTTRQPFKRWTASWIWGEGNGQEKNVYYYFRRTFDLEPAGTYRILVSADTRYQLFINGRFVGRGPSQSQPFYQYYDAHDVTEILQHGQNAIALVVNHVGNMPDTRGGLLLELVDAHGVCVISTDDQWKVRRASAWQQRTHAYHGNKTTPYQEFFDARREPEGWRECSFDDDQWPSATRLHAGLSHPPAVGPWSRLVPRDIPYMTNDPALPVRVERVEESLDLTNRSRAIDLAPGLSMVGRDLRYCRLEGVENLCTEDGETVAQSSREHENLDFDGIYAPAVVLDFGKVITARARLALSGCAGSVVELGYAERLIDGHFNIAMECEFADRYTLKEGEQVFESFTWKSFRYLKIRFRNCAEPLTVKRVLGMISTYPYEERGGFESSDETLNKVFGISRETIRLCSNEFLMDTPWREQAQWLGDVALVTVPAIESCFGDTGLTRKFFIQAGQNQHPTGMISNVSNIVNHHWQSSIPDYSLWWVHGLWNHYLFSGDDQMLHQLYPQALRVLEAHLPYINEIGLIEDMPYWVFVDWAPVEKRGVSTAYNAIFCGVLDAWQSMAELRGDRYVLEQVEALRAAMHKSFHSTLYDSKRGCYADALIDGQLSRAVSEQANMAAVWAGLCPEELSGAVVESVFDRTVVEKCTEAQPFFMAVVLQALGRIGRFDLALDLISQRWGKRMVDKGATSVYEEWYQNGSWRGGDFSGFLRTHSHAWSACPADFLIRHLIGLEILAPGGNRVRVTPQSTPFDYQVCFPLPAGDVKVSCQGGAVRVEVGPGVEITG